MKTYLALFLANILFACKSQNEINKNKNLESAIVYIIPESVTTLLVKEINGKDDKIYFEIENNNDLYTVTVGYILENNKNFYARKSLRMLLLNNRLYPVVFEYDYTFGTPEDASLIVKRFLTDKNPSVRRSAGINEGFFVQFKSNGEIVSTGIGLPSKPKN